MPALADHILAGLMKLDDKLQQLNLNLKDQGCALRILRPEDLGFYLQVYGDAKLMRHIRQPMSARQAHKSLMRMIAEAADPAFATLLLALTDTRNDLPAGIVGIHRHPHQEFELGVILLRSHQSRGLSAQVKRALIPWLFDGFAAESVTAYCRPENAAPNIINQRLGFNKLEPRRFHQYRQLMNGWIISKAQYLAETRH